MQRWRRRKKQIYPACTIKYPSSSLRRLFRPLRLARAGEVPSFQRGGCGSIYRRRIATARKESKSEVQEPVECRLCKSLCRRRRRGGDVRCASDAGGDEISLRLVRLYASVFTSFFRCASYRSALHPKKNYHRSRETRFRVTAAERSLALPK